MEQSHQESNSIIANKNIYLVFTFLFLLFSISFISAVPPVDQPNFALGYHVDYETIDIHKLNTTVLVSTHVYNISTGQRITSPTVNCRLDLYDIDGTQLLTEEAMTYSAPGEEFKFTIDGGNFSRLGAMSQSVYCNSSSHGGFVSHGFLVSVTGEVVSTSDVLASFSLIAAFLLLVAICLVVGNTFQTQYWIYKSFFYFCGILLSIIAINSAKVMARESLQLGVMANMGLLISIVIFGLFLLFIFVNAFKEIIKALRDKREIRWDY
jgi:hypothetical protein|tara:strand:+ start:316 stop:1113 length:798 start_codon:yes stop_codon:yes gene_type:complete